MYAKPYTFPANQNSEAESQKQLRMLPPPSIHMKPFSNLTSEPRRHSISSPQSKKRILSAASVDPYLSDSTTRSTLRYLSSLPTDRHSLATHRISSPDDWVGDGNHMAGSMRQTALKTRSKPRAPRHENTNMDPLFGSKYKDNGQAVVVGSTPVNLSKNRKEKEGVTPINGGALKKANGSSCQPLWTIRREVEGAKDELQTKSSKYPLPNNKKRKCSSKGSFKKLVMSFIEQQKAYFKEIDEYELDVEEVE